MDFFTENYSTMLAVANVISMAAPISLVVFMFFICQSKGKELKIRWYFLGYLFPIIAYFVFRKKDRKEGGGISKYCPACGQKSSAENSACPHCSTPLPDFPSYMTEKIEKSKKYAKYALTVFLCTCVGYLAIMGLTMVRTVSVIPKIGFYFDDANVTKRISCSLRYYDMHGESNIMDSDEVLLYDRNDNIYIRGENRKSEPMYYNIKLNTYEASKCYVDEDGYFYYDAEGEITKGEREVLVTDLYAPKFAYFEWKYYDKQGNVYYPADYASWDEEGNLITEPMPLDSEGRVRYIYPSIG